MTINDTPMTDYPAILKATHLAQFSPVMVQEFIDQRTETARYWLGQAYDLMQGEVIDCDAVLMAICSANDSLTVLEELKPIIAGVEAGIAELVQQRDEATVAFNHLEEEMEERVRKEVDRGLTDALDQAFRTDDDVEEAEIDLLARQMVEGDEQDVIDEATSTLIRKLRKAQELAAEYRANGLPDEDYTEDWDDDDDSA